MWCHICMACPMTVNRCDVTYVQQAAQVAGRTKKFVYFCLSALTYFIYFGLLQYYSRSARFLHIMDFCVYQQGLVQSFSIQSCTDPATGFFVGCTALKALLKTLVYVVFTFIICQNTHSTNTTCAFNPLLQVCKWFGELVFITLVVMSSDDLSHWEKFTDISTFPWLGPSNFVKRNFGVGDRMLFYVEASDKTIWQNRSILNWLLNIFNVTFPASFCFCFSIPTDHHHGYDH